MIGALADRLGQPFTVLGAVATDAEAASHVPQLSHAQGSQTGNDVLIRHLAAHGD